MARTDIHRPAAIVPADYDFVAVRYIGPSPSEHLSLASSRRILADHMNRTGGKYSNHEHGGTCHVCGASAWYLAIYHHRPTNAYICVGEDCADKMDMDGIDAFAPVRRAVKDAREYATGKQRALRLLTERGLEAAKGMQHEIIADLVRKLEQYGNLSDKQWSFLAKLVEEFPAREAQKAARAAERAEKNAASRHFGTLGERRDFNLTVTFRTAFGTAYGTMYVIGMTDADGNVFVYKGSSMLYNAEKNDVKAGDAVVLKATIKEHGEREGVKQTILSRPAQKL